MTIDQSIYDKVYMAKNDNNLYIHNLQLET